MKIFGAINSFVLKVLKNGLSETTGCVVVYMSGLGSEGDEIALNVDDSKQYKVILFVHDKRSVLPSGPKYDQ